MLWFLSIQVGVGGGREREGGVQEWGGERARGHLSSSSNPPLSSLGPSEAESLQMKTTGVCLCVHTHVYVCVCVHVGICLYGYISQLALAVSLTESSAGKSLS